MLIENCDKQTIYEEIFYPEDSNSLQHFRLSKPLTENLASKIQLIFKESTDFFGRIIVYSLKLK